MVRDFQKSRVYRWEDAVVRPRSPRFINFCDAQCFVDGIFLCEAWVGPPKVEKISNQCSKVLATGCRQRIRIPENGVHAWVIIHELAHTLTDDKHGPNFMGMYLKLLDKYLGLSLPLLMYSLKDHKVEYNLAAQPVWIAA